MRLTGVSPRNKSTQGWLDALYDGARTVRRPDPGKGRGHGRPRHSAVAMEHRRVCVAGRPRCAGLRCRASPDAGSSPRARQCHRCLLGADPLRGDQHTDRPRPRDAIDLADAQGDAWSPGRLVVAAYDVDERAPDNRDWRRGRSEERRVGKECRYGWMTCYDKEKIVYNEKHEYYDGVHE